jgi:hypothetical protein
MRLHSHFPILRRSLWAIVFLLSLSPATSVMASAQVVDASVDYTFGGPATFRASIQTAVPIRTVSLSIRAQGETDTLVAPVTPDNQGKLLYQYNLAARPLRAFARVDYWFKVTTQDGVETTSAVFSFNYEDNRFAWKKMESKPFRVHWYGSDEAFAQGVLDVAQQGLQRIQGILPLQTPAQVDIYVYASSSEMQETLLLAGKSWVAGHADPDLGVMVAALPPGPDQRLVTEERIPHELMHIMVYQANPGAYNKLPVWLNEGMASISELYPNPDYQILLETAAKKDSLISIVSLCQGFPTDISGAQLSYAEAAAFTRYLYRQYGSSGLQTLISGYTNGLECSRAVEVAFKTPLTQIESDWRKTIIASTPASGPATEVWPWFAMLGVILFIPLTLGLVGLRKRAPSKLYR